MQAVHKICPVEVALGVIGGKWKGIILFRLLLKTIRFNELHREISGVTRRMLTLQLRELEKDGLVHREVYHQVPPKVEYSLTPLGRELEPHLKFLQQWGTKLIKQRGEIT